jgi:WD40 domain-containing protein
MVSTMLSKVGLIAIPFSIGLYACYYKGKPKPNAKIVNRRNNDHDFTASLKHTIRGTINTVSSQTENKDLTTRMNLLPNGKMITSDTDKCIRIWDSKISSSMNNISFPTEDIVTALLAVDDDSVLYGMSNGSLALLNLKTATSIILLEDKYKVPVTALSILTSGLVIKGSETGNVFTFDPLSKKVIHSFKAHDSPIVSLIALPGNKLLTSGKTTISVWE